jgi:hypothetical protein
LERAVDQIVPVGYSRNDISVLLPDTHSSKQFAHEKNTKTPEGVAAGMTMGALWAEPWDYWQALGRWRFRASAHSTCQIYFYGVNGKQLGTYSCTYTSGQLVESTATINQYLGNKLIASGAETGPNVVFTDRLGSVLNVGPAYNSPIRLLPLRRRANQHGERNG